MNTATRWLLCLILAVAVGWMAAQESGPSEQQASEDVAAEVAALTGGK